MKRANNRLLVIFFGLMTALGFQNCSKVQFGSNGTELSSNKVQATGLEDSNFPADEPLDPTLVAGDGGGIVNNETPGATPNPDDPPAASGTDCEKFAAAESGADVIKGASIVIHKYRGDLKIDAGSLDLSNIRGNVFAKADSAKHLRNMRGGLCLVRASLDHLNNHRGDIELINVQAGFINNTRGTLTINGGHVDKICNHKDGDVVLLNGATVGVNSSSDCDDQ